MVSGILAETATFHEGKRSERRRQRARVIWSYSFKISEILSNNFYLYLGDQICEAVFTCKGDWECGFLAGQMAIPTKSKFYQKGKKAKLVLTELPVVPGTQPTQIKRGGGHRLISYFKKMLLHNYIILYLYFSKQFPIHYLISCSYQPSEIGEK